MRVTSGREPVAHRRWWRCAIGQKSNPVAVALASGRKKERLIKSLCFAQQDEQFKAHMDLIVRIQTVLDVIDRVAREEEVPQ